MALMRHSFLPEQLNSTPGGVSNQLKGQITNRRNSPFYSLTNHWGGGGGGVSLNLVESRHLFYVPMFSSVPGSFLFFSSIGPKTTSHMQQWRRSWLENLWSIPSGMGRKSTSWEETQRRVRSVAPSSTGCTRKLVAACWSQTCRVRKSMIRAWGCCGPGCSWGWGGKEERCAGFLSAPSAAEGVTNVSSDTRWDKGPWNDQPNGVSTF